MGRPMKLVARPQCPLGHPGRIWLDGTYGNKWSPAHERARFTCVPANGGKRHRFTYPERMRHPTPHHPHSGDACPTCEHTYGFGEGPRTGHDFTFTVQEIAKTLYEVGRGESYRHASQLGREAANRYTTGAPDPSREAALAMQYVDVFADLILAPRAPTHWPSIVAVDVLPLRKRRFNPGGPTFGGADRGAVIVAVDHSSPRGKALLLHLSGGKDSASFVEFFNLLAGAPEVIVADAELGLDAAMAKVPGWQNTILYRCEGHLGRNAETAAVRDGIEKWRKVSLPPPTGPLDMYPDSSKSDKEYEVTPIWAAIESCQWNAERWQHLKDVVAAEVPASKKALRQWIAANEALVLEQMRIRHARRGQPMVRSIGAAEGVLGWLRDKIAARAQCFTNERRLRRLLSLMCLQAAGAASEVAYAGVVRDHFRKLRGRSGATWFANRDKAGTKPSLELLLDAADQRAAINKLADDNVRRARELVARKAAQDANRRAGGMEPARGRKRRKLPAEDRLTKGLMVSDFPDLLDTWDYARNEGLDPTTTKASWKARVWWQCPVDESHAWEREVIYRARRGFGCPYCTNRKVCRTNSLRATFPDIAAEWHPKKNGKLTPDDFLPGADTKCWWRCAEGHSFEQLIAARTKQLQGCPMCHRERVRAAAIQQGGGAAGLRKKRRGGRLAADPASPPADEDF
jgi:hypothetical protein